MKATSKAVMFALVIVASTHILKADTLDSSAPTGALRYAIEGLEAGLTEYGRSLALFMGPVITAFGGCRASIAASRHQDWVKPILLTVIGAAVAGALAG